MFTPDHPLRFEPLYRSYLWGGQRLAKQLGKKLPDEGIWAESWEIVDHREGESMVSEGKLAGLSLRQLIEQHPQAILGSARSTASGSDRFPLLLKYLDCQRVLSVQVHPDDVYGAQMPVPDRGKTEAWYVIEADPGAVLYAGLKPGVTRADLRRGIEEGTAETCLHTLQPRQGDCIFIPAGTVHALGAGLIVAEIQQSSDVTYRLYDWNRTGPDGKSRPLHIDAGVEAVTHLGPVDPLRPVPLADPAMSRLVTSDYFLFDEVRPGADWSIGGDDACHFLAVLEGTLHLDDAWNLPPLTRGQTMLLPAAIGRQTLRTVPSDGQAKLLHVMLPEACDRPAGDREWRTAP